MNEELRDHLPLIQAETVSLIEQGVGLVANGYRGSSANQERSTDKDTKIWPMSNVRKVIANTWPYRHKAAREKAVRTLIQAAWPAIQRLAIEACHGRRLTISDVQNTVYPGSATMVMPFAYLLAGRCCAARHTGTEPAYLSIFNPVGHGPEYREIGEPSHPLPPEDLALLALAGPLAALKATDFSVVEPHDKYVRKVNAIAEDTIFGQESGPNGFISRYTPQVEQFNDAHWATIKRSGDTSGASAHGARR